LQLQATSNLEWLAFATALLQVIFAVKNKSINFIFGIISVLCYAKLFYGLGLNADAGLNIYYFIISIYGYYAWQNKSETALKISTTKNKEWLVPALILCVAFPIIYYVQIKFTTNAYALSDSLVAAFAWSGTFLMARKKIENWVLLNVSNAIAIPLYYQKQLVLTSALTIVLFIMAIVGFISWYKQLKK
jgi:nicotinamide mononucleotide transporter